ncbi:hypothetical protein Q3G72_018791 [Acer saccharum]|nr:hypothetical protein Q3G72_018791 [Acer saccharum]
MNQQLLDNFFTDVPVHSSGFATDKNPNVSDESEEVNNNNDDDDDLVSKKQRRQLRNRSRERKKTYLKHLEMKSMYLEGECRRLRRLLQCVVARIKLFILVYILQNGNASLVNQESATLLYSFWLAEQSSELSLYDL